MKIISAPFHAVIDYLFIIILAAAPYLLHLSDNAAMVSYIFVVVHLLLTLITANRGSLLNVIPFRIHGLIEFVAGAVFIGLAFWYSSKSDQQAYYYFLALGLVCIVVFFITDYNNAAIRK